MKGSVRALVSKIERNRKNDDSRMVFIIIAIHVLFLLRFFAKMISSCAVFHDRIILKPNNYRCMEEISSGCAWTAVKDGVRPLIEQKKLYNDHGG